MAKINILKLAEDTNDLNEQLYNFSHRKNVLLTEQQEACRFSNDNNRKSDSKRKAKQIAISKMCRQRKAEKQNSFETLSKETDEELQFFADKRFGLKEKEVTCVEALTYITF